MKMLILSAFQAQKGRQTVVPPPWFGYTYPIISQVLSTDPAGEPALVMYVDETNMTPINGQQLPFDAAFPLSVPFFP